MDGCAAVRLGVGVLEVGVPRCSRADGDVFLPVPVEDVAEGGREQYGMAGGYFRQRRFQCVDGAVRVELWDDQRVGGEAVGAGVVAGDDAGDVGAGDGGEDGVMVVSCDTL